MYIGRVHFNLHQRRVCPFYMIYCALFSEFCAISGPIINDAFVYVYIYIYTCPVISYIHPLLFYDFMFYLHTESSFNIVWPRLTVVEYYVVLVERGCWSKYTDDARSSRG